MEARINRELLFYDKEEIYKFSIESQLRTNLKGFGLSQ